LTVTPIKLTTTQAIDWPHLAREAALFLGLPALLLVYGFNVELRSLAPLQVGAIALTLLALAWLIAGQRAPMPLRTPMLLWLAAYALAVAFSVDPRRSLGQAISMSLAILLFALAADLAARGWSADLWLKAFVFTGGVFLFLDYALFILPFFANWWANHPGNWLPDVFFRLPYSNHQVTVLNLTFLVAAAWLFYARSRLARAGLVALLVILLPPLYLTSSRGGWLGLAAGLAVLALTGLLAGPPSLRALWGRLRASRILQVALGLAVLAATAALLVLMIRQGSNPTHGGFLTSRSEYWPVAWQSFLADPLTGSGPHTYVSAYLAAHPVPPGTVFGHAHSLPFNLLAETGLIGFLAFAFLAVSLLRALLARLAAAPITARPLVWAAVAALFAFGVHNLFDTLHQEPVGLWDVILLVAPALAADSAPFATVPARRARPWAVLLPVAAVWLYLYTVTPYYHGLAAVKAGDLAAARAHLALAAVRDPRSPQPFQQLGLIEAQLSASDATALPRAIAAYTTAADLDPTWPLNHANQAALLAAAGDLPAARDAWAEAVRRAPNAALFQLNLADVEEQLGNAAAARAAAQSALALNPAWAGQSFWIASPLRAALQPATADPAPALDENTLLARVQADPNDITAYLGLARLAFDPGDDAATTRWVNAGLTVTSLEPLPTLELRWYQAALQARQGNLPAAADQGRYVIENILRYGAAGPAAADQPYYSLVAFYLPAQAAELVPQMLTPTPSDEWIDRAGQVIGWQREVGLTVEAEGLQSLLDASLHP
jgi:O-antigen ligase